MFGDRSVTRVLQSTIDIKDWIASPPAVDAVRPSVCPVCDAAGRPLGAQIVIVGHGLREREIRGPLEPFGQVRGVLLRLRRYLCRACGAVLTVVPRGIIFRRLFSAFAIGSALGFFGLARESAVQVRSRLTTWRVKPHTLNRGWPSLKRWSRAARAQDLFGRIRRCSPAMSLRQAAAHVASALAAHAPASSRSHEIALRAGLGAVQVA